MFGSLIRRPPRPGGLGEHLVNDLFAERDGYYLFYILFYILL